MLNQYESLPLDTHDSVLRVIDDVPLALISENPQIIILDWMLPRELLTRMRVRMREMHPQQNRQKKYFSGLELDPVSRVVKYQNTALELTKLEYDLLNLLMEEPGMAIINLFGKLLSLTQNPIRHLYMWVMKKTNLVKNNYRQAPID